MHFKEVVAKILYAKTAGGGFFRPLDNLTELKPEEGRKLLLERAQEMEGLFNQLSPFEVTRFYEEFEIICLIATVFALACVNEDVPIQEQDLQNVHAQVETRLNGFSSELAGCPEILVLARRLVTDIPITTPGYHEIYKVVTFAH